MAAWTLPMPDSARTASRPYKRPLKKCISATEVSCASSIRARSASISQAIAPIKPSSFMTASPSCIKSFVKIPAPRQNTISSLLPPARR